MDNDKTEEELSARKRVTECKKYENKDEKVNCMYKVLHDITEAQDITNLTIRKEIDNSEDPRWFPIHIVDDANGVILGISRNKGIPKQILKEGYVEDKVNGLNSKFTMLKWKREKD